MTDGAGDIVVYTDPDGLVQVRLEEGSVLLSLAQPGADGRALRPCRRGGRAETREANGATFRDLRRAKREGSPKINATCKPSLQVQAGVRT